MDFFLVKLSWIGLWLQCSDLSLGGAVYLPFQCISFKENNGILFYSERNEIIHSGEYAYDKVSVCVDKFIKFDKIAVIDSNVITCNIVDPELDSLPEDYPVVAIKMIKLTPTKVSILDFDSIKQYTWFCKEKQYPFYSNEIRLVESYSAENQGLNVFTLDHIEDYWFIKVSKNNIVVGVFPIVSMDDGVLKVLVASNNMTLTLTF